MTDQKEKAIRDGQRVKQFLADEVIDGAFKSVASDIYAEFRQADSSEKRVTAWAKSNALEAILTELNAIASRGEYEAKELEKAERRKKEI